jgi:predicted flap endonuclease-1-like 5' DNA nuclease
MDLITLIMVVVGVGLLLVLYRFFVSGKQSSSDINDKKVAYKPEEILAPINSEQTIDTHQEEAESDILETEAPEISARKIKIIEIEGIGPIYSERLNEIGIQYIDELLDAGASRSDREALARQTEIPHRLILEWINLADLFRIDGIGEEWSDLLEEAGVDTVVELAQRNPINLHSTLDKVNESTNIVQRVPSVEQISDWVEKAKKLPSKIEY